MTSRDVVARNRALLAWYDRHRRPLPWRGSRDPWAILVCEVMSQQTRIDRVAERWEPFLERFPTPNAMAEAAVGDVIAAWSGLGYNRRAKALHATATIVASDGWPRDAEGRLDPVGLQALPGIGPYTAAAVASIVDDVSVPAIDTNLRRVLSRWSGRPLAGVALQEAAMDAIDLGRPGDWNQATMELGATRCGLRPDCDDCPVHHWCAAPGLSLPSRSSSPFEGSNREARGRVLAAVTGGPMDLHTLRRTTGLDDERIRDAVVSLLSDGLATVYDDGTIGLP